MDRLRARIAPGALNAMKAAKSGVGAVSKGAAVVAAVGLFILATLILITCMFWKTSSTGSRVGLTIVVGLMHALQFAIGYYFVVYRSTKYAAVKSANAALTEVAAAVPETFKQNIIEAHAASEMAKKANDEFRKGFKREVANRSVDELMRRHQELNANDAAKRSELARKQQELMAATAPIPPSTLPVSKPVQPEVPQVVKYDIIDALTDNQRPPP